MAPWAKAPAAEPPDDPSSVPGDRGGMRRTRPDTHYFLEKHFERQSESTQQREQEKEELPDLRQKTIQWSCLLEAHLGE